MAKAKYKSRATRLEEALQQIEAGQAEVQALAEEMGNWRDNMGGTNLENTEKYQAVEQAADQLEQCADDIDNAMQELQGVEFPGMFG